MVHELTVVDVKVEAKDVEVVGKAGQVESTAR